MKILNNDQNSEAWFDDRLGKITGSKFKDILVKRGNNKKIGFYQLIADKLATTDGYTDAMERGHELEPEALKVFSEKTGKEIEQVGLCVADFNDDIALSPDGLIKVNGKYLEAVEVKCLSSARHLQAHFEQEVPDEYYEQLVQYFIVNEDLERLYFVFFDPRISALPIHWITIERKDVEDDVKKYREYQEEVIKEANELLSSLMF